MKTLFVSPRKSLRIQCISFKKDLFRSLTHLNYRAAVTISLSSPLLHSCPSTFSQERRDGRLHAYKVTGGAACSGIQRIFAFAPVALGSWAQKWTALLSVGRGCCYFFFLSSPSPLFLTQASYSLLLKCKHPKLFADVNSRLPVEFCLMPLAYEIGFFF